MQRGLGTGSSSIGRSFLRNAESWAPPRASPGEPDCNERSPCEGCAQGHLKPHPHPAARILVWRAKEWSSPSVLGSHEPMSSRSPHCVRKLPTPPCEAEGGSPQVNRGLSHDATSSTAPREATSSGVLSKPRESKLSAIAHLGSLPCRVGGILGISEFGGGEEDEEREAVCVTSPHKAGETGRRSAHQNRAEGGHRVACQCPCDLP